MRVKYHHPGKKYRLLTSKKYWISTDRFLKPLPHSYSVTKTLSAHTMPTPLAQGTVPVPDINEAVKVKADPRNLHWYIQEARPEADEWDAT